MVANPVVLFILTPAYSELNIFFPKDYHNQQLLNVLDTLACLRFNIWIPNCEVSNGKGTTGQIEVYHKLVG